MGFTRTLNINFYFSRLGYIFLSSNNKTILKMVLYLLIMLYFNVIICDCAFIYIINRGKFKFNSFMYFNWNINIFTSLKTLQKLHLKL